jgi:hypothetical protein
MAQIENCPIRRNGSERLKRNAPKLRGQRLAGRDRKRARTRCGLRDFARGERRIGRILRGVSASWRSAIALTPPRQ